MGAQSPSVSAKPAGEETEFSAFGPVSVETLPRLQVLTGAVLARNWATIPHVTHHDDADITELDRFRAERNAGQPERKLTLLPFIIKAMVAAMKTYPRFNASLDASGHKLVLKHYFHIGIVIDTATLHFEKGDLSTYQTST
jgi:pyruvate dehydrogenase E2 component (dihydrolipoamide acetyltransferase)